MKKMLITGATGFLGKNFMQCINRKEYEIFVLGRTCPESVDEKHFYFSELTKLDMNGTYSVMEKIHAEVLVLIAWDVSTQSYWNAYENHIWADVSIQLALAFLTIGGGWKDKQIIFFGTSASYDCEIGWMREIDEFEHPSTVYGITKLYASKMIQKLSKEYGAAYCEVRIFSVYGRYERSSRLVPLTIQRLLQKERVIIDRGGLVRDYLYAEDVADAIYRCLINQAEGIYNISSAQPVTICQIVMKIADILDVKNLVGFCKNEKLNAREAHLIVGDNSKIKRLGFEPKYTLYDGINKTLKWMQEVGRI